jgi:4-hydroxybenzoate polyprenyltransferase
VRNEQCDGTRFQRGYRAGRTRATLMSEGSHSLGPALLVLGRVSNLPTVWSNCLAGWALAGSVPLTGDFRQMIDAPVRFLVLCAGASLLYIGGMYLNDAFDADFDRQHRRERPIPSGAIPAGAVWTLGCLWLAAGLSCVVWLAQTNRTTAVLALLLVAAILLYDAVHKAFTLSPVLMGVCRLLLVLMAASAARLGITGLTIWSALVLALYVVGLSYIARHESLPGTIRYWPCIFLAAPIVLAAIVNRGDWKMQGRILSAMLIVWSLQALRFTYWSPEKNLGRTVTGLLAGIVLVDLLAVGAATPQVAVLFGALFALTVVAQRFVPAT